jgi:DNA-binding XRE family transcriptional regulator
MALSPDVAPGARVLVEAELVTVPKRGRTPEGVEVTYCTVRFKGNEHPVTVFVMDVTDPPEQEFRLTSLDFDATRTKIAVNLRMHRQRANLSQTRLAELIGVTQNAVSKWENGYTVPRFYTVPALIGALGITTEELYGDIH